LKIKTITCHEVYNHGATLQEYALLKYLESKGHKAEAINYKPPYLSNHFNMWSISNPFFKKNIVFKILYIILKLPKRIINLRRKRAFDSFSKTHIKSTKIVYHSNEELKRHIPKAEAFICGSDQIWNSFFQNGKDPAFYLDFVPNDKLKLSYAASFAIDKLEDEIKSFVRESVSRLNFVSVREESGKKILEDLGIKNVHQVLDPVFLLPPEDWEFLQSQSKENNDYIFIYDFDSNPLIEKMALLLKGKFNWNIITVNELITYADKNYFLYGPDKFLSLIKNARFVISNSFHAVAFSIIFQKDFVVFNREDKINTRMRDLLQSIGLEHLLISNEEMALTHQVGSLNYSEINTRLNLLIDKSKNYLNNSLNSTS